MAQAIRAILSSQFTRRLFQQYRGPRLMCNFAKDVVPTNETSSTTLGPDFLLTNLKNAASTDNVLDMVNKHNNIMNNKHIIQALRTLFTLQKCGNSNLSTKQILTNSDFKKLCQKLRSQAGTIELSEAIEALKVVSYVGVPGDSTITQVLLQLIRHNVNQLSLQQIIFLDFLLNQFKWSPLIEALKIALPIVFEINLPLKMDYDNAGQLAEYLFYTTRNTVSSETIERIVNSLMACKFDYNAKTAKSIIWSICDMEPDLALQPLFQKAMESLVLQMDELNFTDIESTLTKVSSRFNRRFDYFYNEVFYDSCANYVIDNDLGFENSIYVLRKLARVTHHSKTLLEYMTNKVFENPDLITKGLTPVNIYSIVVSMSLTDYRPKNWEFLKSVIAQTENIANCDRNEIVWIRFASALCLLDIYKVDVLTKALSETFLQNLFKKKFRSDFENYFTCWELIKVNKPELNCLLSSRFTPEVLLNRFSFSFNYPLENALKKGLGGDSYVTTELYSKFGFRLDHVVMFRRGGFPVANAIPEEIKFLEDLEVPPENQLVIIKGISNFNYTINTKQIISSVNNSIKICENKGYYVVPINVGLWENLPDFEKIPYLMQAIKEKININLHTNEDLV